MAAGLGQRPVRGSRPATRLGADPTTAGTIWTAVNIAVPWVVSAGQGAARLAAIRTGRISLTEHEAERGPASVDIQYRGKLYYILTAFPEL